jgi:hypothetical protein
VFVTAARMNCCQCSWHAAHSFVMPGASRYAGEVLIDERFAVARGERAPVAGLYPARPSLYLALSPALPIVELKWLALAARTDMRYTAACTTANTQLFCHLCLTPA